MILRSVFRTVCILSLTLIGPLTISGGRAIAADDDFLTAQDDDITVVNARLDDLAYIVAFGWDSSTNPLYDQSANWCLSFLYQDFLWDQVICENEKDTKNLYPFQLSHGYPRNYSSVAMGVFASVAISAGDRIDLANGRIDGVIGRLVQSALSLASDDRVALNGDIGSLSTLGLDRPDQVRLFQDAPRGPGGTKAFLLKKLKQMLGIHPKGISTHGACHIDDLLDDARKAINEHELPRKPNSKTEKGGVEYSKDGDGRKPVIRPDPPLVPSGTHGAAVWDDRIHVHAKAANGDRFVSFVDDSGRLVRRQTHRGGTRLVPPIETYPAVVAGAVACPPLPAQECCPTPTPTPTPTTTPTASPVRSELPH